MVRLPTLPPDFSWTVPRPRARALAWRRRALAAMLAAKIVGGWGLAWDIRWHLTIGRDSFWIAPHVMTYFAVVALAVLSLGVLLVDTWRARAGALDPGVIRLGGLVGTRGFHLAWWGTVLILLAAPIDELWHRRFGIDVTLWSPPHLLGIAGAQVSTIACVLIALEVWPACGGVRRLALLLAIALALGLFETVADPAIQTAFLHGRVFFFTWAALGALLFSGPLVLASRLDGRVAPVAVVATALLVQVSGLMVSDLGFALIRPTPAIEETIAENPASPIAIAHEMARRDGSATGPRPSLRLLLLVPALVLSAVDARRRWAPATLAFGAALMATSGVIFARSPALAHALPGVGDTLAAIPIVLAASLIGGALGARLQSQTR